MIPYSDALGDQGNPFGPPLLGASLPPWAPQPPEHPAAGLAAALPLFGPDQVVELRVLHYTTDGRYPKTLSGYFDQDHLLELAAAVIASTSYAAGVYCTLNAIDPALLARRANRIDVAGNGDATTDRNVVGRRFVPVDVDPVRPSGIRATDAEKAAAGKVAERVLAHFRGIGWPDPIVIDSGNGRHLLYPTDPPADDGGLTERCIRAVAAWFDTGAVKVDTSVHNPARILRLPGTRCRKGDRLTGPAEPLQPHGPLPASRVRVTTWLRHGNRHGDILHGVRDAADNNSPVNHVIRRAGTDQRMMNLGRSGESAQHCMG